jgi:hypothetical protein
MTKAKRKLSDISFEKLGAHIALTSKAAGGPANGHDYALVLKAANFTDEHVQKASKIRVTMDIQDFLQKFFGVYYSDALVLAQALGFDTSTESDNESTYEDYIQSQVQSIEVLKSLHDAEDIKEVLGSLDPEEYLAMLKDQETLEKALKKLEKQAKTKSDKEPKATKSDETSTNASVEKSVEPKSGSESHKESTMTQGTQVIEKEVEVVEKSQFTALEKALDENKVALEKALSTIAAFEAEKKEAIAKAKTAKIQEIVKDEKKTAALAKAALSLESEDDFSAFVAAVQAMMSTVETSEMFVEKGAKVDEAEPAKETPIEKALKAKYGAKKA